MRRHLPFLLVDRLLLGRLVHACDEILTSKSHKKSAEGLLENVSLLANKTRKKNHSSSMRWFLTCGYSAANLEPQERLL